MNLRTICDNFYKDVDVEFLETEKFPRGVFVDNIFTENTSEEGKARLCFENEWPLQRNAYPSLWTKISLI